MEPTYDGCRLCLDPFATRFTTIDSPALKDQMEKVFCFSVEPKQGYSSGVCQSCSYSISEFYQYSEKVRQNQEVLSGNIDHKITLESVTTERLSDSGHEETKEKTRVGEPSCEEAPTLDLKITLGSVKIETASDSGLPEGTEHACESEDEVSGEEVPTLETIITIGSVKVEALSDSGLPETKEDACESKDEVLGEDGLIDPPAKKSPIRRSGRLKKRKHLEADAPTKNSTQNTKRTQQQLHEQDQLFKKHFSMICDLCGMSAVTFTDLRSHFRKEHKRRHGYVVCCNKKLFKRCLIQDHLDFHANPDVFRCKVCGMKCKSKDTLNDHLLCRHSSEDQRPFKCDLCPQSFAQKSALTEHMKRHVKVKCPECNNMFANKNSLSTHMTNQHSGKDRTMVCDKCGQEFLSKQYYDRHIKEHMGFAVPRLQCEICQRWLKGTKNFRNHMKTVHSDGEQQLQCGICLHKYPHSRALRLHTLYTHGEPKHKCEFCDKKFQKTIDLKEHRTTHTGETLYTCEFCGETKKNRANLYKHITRYHPMEKAQKKLMKSQKTGPS